MSQHDHAFRVPPRGRKGLQTDALFIRNALKITTAFFPLIEVIEHVLPRLMPEFILDVREMNEMKREYGNGTLAMTTPTSVRLELRDDVYEELHRHDGRARFTVAHELGHMFLHRSETGFARFDRSARMPLYESSEWQADRFAAELLMPLSFATACSSAVEIKTMFGVSMQSAEIRWTEVDEERAKRIGSLSVNSGNHK